MPLSRPIVLAAALVALFVVAAGGYLLLRPPGPLLSGAGFDRAQISPNADGVDDVAIFAYRLARPATISLTLEGAFGARFDFRRDERRSSGRFQVEFSGVVDGYTLPGEEIAGAVERRLIPNDTYTWTLEARAGSRVETATGTLAVAAGDSALPLVTVFEISPQTFTPNQDGIRDRVSVNVYLAKDADLQVYLEDAAGARTYLDERELGRQPGEMGSHEYDYDGGVDQDFEPPPDGTYAVYAVAQDAEGQRIMRQSALTIEDGGLPRVEIAPQTTGAVVYFETQPYDARTFTDATTEGARLPLPEGIASDRATITMPQGDLLVFKLTVNNYGAAPIRTAGPFPGTVYDFDQTAGSLEAFEESGAWRVGIECDTSFTSFPWRWALAPLDELTAVYDAAADETYYYLQPGQRAEVWGAIRMSRLFAARNPQDCWAGLIHEDVEIPAFQSRVGEREIELVPPPGTPPPR